MANKNTPPVNALPDEWYGEDVTVYESFGDSKGIEGNLEYTNQQGVMLGIFFFPWSAISNIALTSDTRV